MLNYFIWDPLTYLTFFYFLFRALRIICKFIEFYLSIVRIFSFGILFSCCFEAVFGIMQYTHLLPINTRLIYDSVVTGTFGNANTLAGFLAAGLPFLFESFSKKPKSIFLLFLLLLILNLLTLLLTKSRGSWIGLLIGTSLFFYSPIKKWLKNQYIRKMQIIITLVTLVSIIALFLFLFFINKPSSTGRLFIWKISILMIRDFPLFGIGYGNYEVRYLNYQASFFQNVANMRYSHYASNIKHAHNEYIHILAETGFLGLMLFLSIIIFFYIVCFKIIKYNKTNSITNITKAILSSTTIILIHSIVDCPLRVIPINILFYFNLSVITSIAIFKKSFYLFSFFKIKIPNLREVHRIVNLAILIIYILFGLKFMIIITQKAHGYMLWKNGFQLINSKNLHQAIKSYEKALHHLPAEGELHFHLGGAYLLNKEFNVAINEFEIALKTFNDKNIYISLGMAYQGLKDYQSAETYYQIVIDMYPNLIFPKFLLAEMLFSNNDYVNSYKILKEIAIYQPKILNENIHAIKKAANDLIRYIETNNDSVIYYK